MILIHQNKMNEEEEEEEKTWNTHSELYILKT